MKSLPFDMIALHIQAELPYLLCAYEHTLQHCWVIVRTAAEMLSRRCYKSLIFTLFTWIVMWPRAKKSRGESAAQNRGEPRPIQRPGNLSLR